MLWGVVGVLRLMVQLQLGSSGVMCGLGALCGLGVFDGCRHGLGAVLRSGCQLARALVSIGSQLA